MFRETDLRKIIKCWGEDKQKIKAIEELSELQKELCKNLLNQIDDKKLEEEISDVQIMLNQLMIMYGISKNDVEYHMNLKIKRTIEIINTLSK